MRLYFVVLILFAAVTAAASLALAAGEGIVIMILFVYSKITISKQRSRLLDYIEEVTYSVESVKKDNMINFPMPMVIFRLDNNEIVWSNGSFANMTGEREHFFERGITDVLPDFPVKWLMEGKNQCPELIQIGDRKYQVYGNIVRTESENEGYQFLGNAYWVDVTDYARIQKEYYESKPICALIVLDNYDEFIINMTEKEKSTLLAVIDDKITAWADEAAGLLVKLDRDRYMLMIEERSLRRLRMNKFSLLNHVREVVSPGGIPATVSIGIGKEGVSFSENYSFAVLGIEMCLSRGGDQVAIKNKFSFEFFGGRAPEQEKRTKVKSRVVASSLAAFIGGVNNVFVMGHKYADMDSLGAAVGICCIARKKGASVRIVIDLERNAVGQMLEMLRETTEYADVFISPQEAILLADSKCLLVVVDTNRPAQVESEALLDACNHVTVIDHHRRAADYIENTVISFHEPYASSTCELVAELLQYIVEPRDILRVEAEFVMAGIVMDTKNFTIRTGSRTFEAAAFLRKVGASTATVKRLMQSDLAGTVAKYHIVSHAKLYKSGIAIVTMPQSVERITAAQAADELINISGIRTSFVLYPESGGAVISARSTGDIDVQVILERLGGGGNQSAAGAQVKDQELSQVTKSLAEAIDAYLADNPDSE